MILKPYASRDGLISYGMPAPFKHVGHPEADRPAVTTNRPVLAANLLTWDLSATQKPKGWLSPPTGQYRLLLC